MYYRYIHSNNKTYGAKPKFVNKDELDKLTGFSSLYAVTEDTAKAITEAGTTQQFKGVVWSERLWLDFDTEEASNDAQSKLETMGYDIIVYHSGNRGIHVGILRDHPPSHLLPAKDKAWVTTHFPGADTSIYTPLHLFRLPGTSHEKTGRLKEFITHLRGGVLRLPPPQVRQTDLRVNATKQSMSQRSIFECWRVMANTVPTRNGERHPTLVKLCYALRDEAGVDASFAFVWLVETNKMCEEPKDDTAIEQIVRSIYGGI